MTGLISLDDLTAEQIQRVALRATELYRNPREHSRPLADHIIATMFLLTSTRTRTAFSAAAIRLGAQVLAYGPNDLQLNTGETITDTGRILASMVDGVVARIPGPSTDLSLLSGGALPVVNAMSADEHPTQAINDLAMLTQHFGDLAGLRLLYVGEANNTAIALAKGLQHYSGCHTTLWSPASFSLDPVLVSRCNKTASAVGGSVTAITDAADLPDEVDVVYTTRWETTGTVKKDPAWRELFREFYVDDTFLARWPTASVMHDLPAHRGQEISAAVLDGPRCIAWQQGAMKMASAMAVLEYAVGAMPVAESSSMGSYVA